MEAVLKSVRLEKQEAERKRGETMAGSSLLEALRDLVGWPSFVPPPPLVNFLHFFTFCHGA